VIRFLSTRDAAPAVPVSEALVRGLAPDGGLYVPERFPAREEAALSAPADDLPGFAAALLGPYFEGDPLQSALPGICRDTFSFPVPLVFVPDASGRIRDTAVLEVFHGPTAAFKDVGARFLAACLERLPGGDRIILVATSGDTGGAVAAAFHGRPRVQVGILFPRDGVSERQEKQLTGWDANVRAFRVNGTFDDCQRLLKETLAAARTRPGAVWTTANSINIGRLLAQTVSHAWGAVAYRRARNATPGFIVPTGNAGNAVAALWARAMGLPIREVMMATNANRAIPEYFEAGTLTPRPPVKTLANAMDVGNPSNMERMLHLFERDPSLRQAASAVSVDDATIREVIAEGPERWDRVWDPHTATAIRARDLRPEPDWVAVATAHPAKFHTIVEPLAGRPVPVPPALAAILARPSRAEALDPRLEDLMAALEPRS